MTNELSSAPLIALSMETQVMLSNLLNPTKIIQTEGNLPRDWRGVAELAGVPCEMINLFEMKPDPFKEVLNYVSTKEKISLETEDLKAFLALIDRYDVLEDIEYLIERDKLSYLTRIQEIALDCSVETVDTKLDSRVITYEDALRTKNGLALSRYDAFILYADDDAEFASDVIQMMEGDYNLKLCSKDRDLLPGLRFEHEVIGSMIENRCNRLLVILSPSFLDSSENQFLVSYAQAVALDTRGRKIIPCVYRQCELPVSLRYSFCIDYNRSGKLWNFWEKLNQSLIAAKDTSSVSYNVKSMDFKPLTRDTNCVNESSSVSPNIPENLDWWESSKPTSTSPELLDSLKSVMIGNGYDPKEHSNENRDDTVSMHSQAHLLPGSTSSLGSKSPKWLSKIMKPMKQRKQKNKNRPEKAIAE